MEDNGASAGRTLDERVDAITRDAIARAVKAILDSASHLDLCARLQEECGRPEGPGNASIHRKHAAALRSAADEIGGIAHD